MLRSVRSAKSVAWMRLKVSGVSRWRALPRLVALFTSSDEFHSEKNVL